MSKFRGSAIILLILFLSSMNVYAEGNKNIEIFDITQEKVVKVVQPNQQVEKLVLDYLHQIDGFVAKCDPIPNKGYAIRVPLESSVKIQNRWINGTVDEVIIIIEGETLEPFLVVFENGQRFLCLHFKGNLNKLSKVLGFKL